MRTREEIYEETINAGKGGSGSQLNAAINSSILEVLLDIRELLTSHK